MAKKEKQTGPQPYRPKNGDKIICEHKGLRYEARVLSTREETPGEKQFLVHYQGWNKNWDEWVNEDRVLQHNEANVALMKEQQRQPKSKLTASGRKKLAVQPGQSQTNSSESSTPTRPSEPAVDVEQLKKVPKPRHVADIKLPEELVNWLIDDDSRIKNRSLNLIPAKTTISAILKDFVNHKKSSTKSPAEKESVYNELTLGIRAYFNAMLGPHLLYKFERLQYQTLLKDHGKNLDLSNHYGLSHLIRLFTKISSPLGSSSLDAQSVQSIVDYIHELMKFISKQDHLFDPDESYVAAPPDYIKAASK